MIWSAGNDEINPQIGQTIFFYIVILLSASCLLLPCSCLRILSAGALSEIWLAVLPRLSLISRFPPNSRKSQTNWGGHLRSRGINNLPAVLTFFRERSTGGSHFRLFMNQNRQNRVDDSLEYRCAPFAVIVICENVWTDISRIYFRGSAMATANFSASLFPHLYLIMACGTEHCVVT